MASPDTSLESLLQILTHAPEEGERVLIRSAVSLLREVCNSQSNSLNINSSSAAKKVRDILDEVLEETADSKKTVAPKKAADLKKAEVVCKEESHKAEEFLPLPDEAEYSKDTTILADEDDQPDEPDEPNETEGVIFPDSEAEEETVFANPEETSLLRLVEKWNAKEEPWFHIPVSAKQNYENTLREVIYSAAAVRSNLATACIANRSMKDDSKRFERYWKQIVQQAQKDGYEIFPKQFGRLAEPEGKVIYSCRPRLEKQENALLVPGLASRGKEIFSPLSLVTLPPKQNFPENHPHKDLPPQWRAILGELELLLTHLDIQNTVVCSIESINNKKKIEPYSQCKEPVQNEIKRRANALCNAINQKESIYRLATNYWRVEECFWSVYHGDERPTGYSFFDRLRRRTQAWRTTIRNQDQLLVRDFSPGVQSLASINKYIGNIILERKEGVSPGTVLREIRPSIIVQVNKVTRLLKGRVIST